MHLTAMSFLVRKHSARHMPVSSFPHKSQKDQLYEYMKVSNTHFDIQEHQMGTLRPKSWSGSSRSFHSPGRLSFSGSDPLYHFLTSANVWLRQSDMPKLIYFSTWLFLFELILLTWLGGSWFLPQKWPILSTVFNLTWKGDLPKWILLFKRWYLISCNQLQS